jgi:hypothetical protein
MPCAERCSSWFDVQGVRPTQVEVTTIRQPKVDAAGADGSCRPGRNQRPLSRKASSLDCGARHSIHEVGTDRQAAFGTSTACSPASSHAPIHTHHRNSRGSAQARPVCRITSANHLPGLDPACTSRYGTVYPPARVALVRHRLCAPRLSSTQVRRGPPGASMAGAPTAIRALWPPRPTSSPNPAPPAPPSHPPPTPPSPRPRSCA